MLKRWPWCLALFLFATLALPAADTEGFKPKPHDWPQWQGADRTAVSRETGLLKSWPKEGPPLAWKVKGVGGGFSTPSIAAGRVFGMGFVGDDEVVWALEEATGKEIWSTRIAKATRGIDHGSGPRCTPTVDGDRLYALGIAGELACLESASGKMVWQKNLTSKEFGGRRPGWGYSESPLVDGDKLIVTPGGKDATLAALNKKTGEIIWKAQVPGGDGAAYSSVIVADSCNRRQYIQFLNRGVVGVAAADGKFLWRYNKPANGTANCSTPIYHDNSVFAASGYGTGGGLVQLSQNQDGVKADEVYFTKNMKNHHGGMVLLDGYLYGSDEGMLTCLEFKTGKVMWAERRTGKGSIVYADGRLYYRNEGGRGALILVDANPKQYVEHGRFDQPDRSDKNAWPHPVIANGKLYIRDQDVLLCYDVKQR
jgi:outer membrane protein assembly factor BamB